jgi:hypothetical protein
VRGLVAGVIIRDRHRSARLDALAAILAFTTPGEVQVRLVQAQRQLQLQPA